MLNTNYVMYQIKMRIRDFLISRNNPLSLIDFSPQHKYLLKQQPINLIVHVGADTGQESFFYELLGIEKAYWIEPDTRSFAKLERRLSKHSKSHQIAINALLSSRSNSELKLNLFTLSGANSVYELKEIRKDKNKSKPTGKTMKFLTKTLSELIENNQIDLRSSKKSLLVIDVQGHELHVLQGLLDRDLKLFDLVMCEVSKIEIYKGAATYEELKSYLFKHGFSIVFEGARRAYDDVIFRNNSASN